MKLLVVEDDKKLGGFLRKGLEARGFIVDFCDHGDEGYALATTRSYDAIVLDIMLPGRDGLSVLRNLSGPTLERSSDPAHRSQCAQRASGWP